MAAVSPAGPAPTIRQWRSGSLIVLQRRVMAIVPRAAAAYSDAPPGEEPNVMGPWIAALLLASLPAQAMAQTSAPSMPSPPPSPAVRIEQIGPTLAPIFERYRAEQHVPGLVYGIVAEGRLVYVRGMGSLTQDAGRVVTPDSLFRIASMSKAFTALAILKL